MNRTLMWAIVLELVITLGVSTLGVCRDTFVDISGSLDWSKVPVFAADCKVDPFKLLSRPDWAKSTEAKMLAYVMARVKDMRPTTDNWYDSAELFRAAYSLAMKCPEGQDGARQQWIRLALAAARRSLTQDPNCTYLSFWCVLNGGPELSRTAGLDPQVRDGLVALYRSYEKQSRFPALHMFNIYCVLNAAGDQKGARDALEDAYLLCPNDSAITSQLKGLRAEMGDVSGAQQISPGSVTDALLVDHRSNTLSDFADQKLTLAEEALSTGRIAEAKRDFEKAWRTLERMEQLRQKEGAVPFPGTGMSRNKCATGLGLIAIGREDIPGAIEWLKRSDAKGMWLEKIGYDLRLARKLSTVPSAREAVITYLQKASRYGSPKSKEDVQKLLKQVERAKSVGRR